ncbi:MAG: transcription antitermination factor NusB [Chloroflexi bacterium]|nr:transcription antitermination factor NusB [Chloroflexota bacterium]
MSSPRREARIVALQTLFEADTVRHDLEGVLERNLEEGGLVQEAADYACDLVRGVWQHRQRLDNIISKSAPNWPVEQMAGIDKNILRLAIYEIMIDNRVPVKAAINEAVELAKLFGSDSSGRFINGVLGTVISQSGK